MNYLLIFALACAGLVAATSTEPTPSAIGTSQWDNDAQGTPAPQANIGESQWTND